MVVGTAVSRSKMVWYIWEVIRLKSPVFTTQESIIITLPRRPARCYFFPNACFSLTWSSEWLQSSENGWSTITWEVVDWRAPTNSNSTPLHWSIGIFNTHIFSVWDQFIAVFLPIVIAQVYIQCSRWTRELGEENHVFSPFSISWIGYEGHSVKNNFFVRYWIKGFQTSDLKLQN